MVKYQAYFVGPDGRFASQRVFACYTDEQAIEWTKQLMDPERPAELADELLAAWPRVHVHDLAGEGCTVAMDAAMALVLVRDHAPAEQGPLERHADQRHGLWCFDVGRAASSTRVDPVHAPLTSSLQLAMEVGSPEGTSHPCQRRS